MNIILIQHDFSQYDFSHLVQQMKMICWLSGYRPQYRSCTANSTEQYLARSQISVFGVGGHKNLGGGGGDAYAAETRRIRNAAAIW